MIVCNRITYSPVSCSRGHAFAVTDVRETLRTGAPKNAEDGPLPMACWSCKSPDVARLIQKDGEDGYRRCSDQPSNVYTVPKSSIGPSGGSVAATQLTNISGRTIEGTAISNSAEMIVCNRITANDFPSDGIGQIVWRAQIRLLAATKGTKARILIASAWWTNNRNNKSKNGLHQFYLDFETANNSYSNEQRKERGLLRYL